MLEHQLEETRREFDKKSSLLEHVSTYVCWYEKGYKANHNCEKNYYTRVIQKIKRSLISVLA